MAGIHSHARSQTQGFILYYEYDTSVIFIYIHTAVLIHCCRIVGIHVYLPVFTSK